PATDANLRMTATGTVKGKVLRPDGKPAVDAQVGINPEGDPIGKWGGSMNVKSDGTFQFDGVPPGIYMISTNPGLAQIGKDPATKKIEVKAGQSVDLELTKK